MLLEGLFHLGKNVFVPKIVSPKPTGMQMIQARSMDEIRSYPKGKYSIPEPSIILDPIGTLVEGEEKLHVIVMPGLAFDHDFNRLGHGKGYYGMKGGGGKGRDHIIYIFIPSIIYA